MHIRILALTLLAACQPSSDYQPTAGDGPRRGDEAVGLAPTPTLAAVSVASAHQGTPGSGGVLTLVSGALAGGDLLVGARFAGEVELGGVVLQASEERYRHNLIARATADGGFRYVRHLCDSCVGPMGESNDGRVAFATTATHCVGEPGGDAPIDVSDAESGMVITVIDTDGAIVTMRRFASGTGNVRAVSAFGDGWLVAGDATLLTFTDDTHVTGAGLFYPGRAFIAELNADLEVEAVEVLGGTAGSSVSMLSSWNGGIVAVGDFGGYPHGATTTFGDQITLESISADDDPAFDVFIAHWTSTGELAFARRVQHYANGLRPPTLLRVVADRLAYLLNGAGDIEIENGEVFFGYGGEGSALMEFGVTGDYLNATPLPYGASSWADTPDFLSVAHTYLPTMVVGEPPEHFSFEVPEQTEELSWAGLVLAQWSAAGQLGYAGQLLYSRPRSRYPLTVHGVATQADGSVLVYLNGSTPITLEPEVDEPIPLPAAGYERPVFVHLRLRPR